MGIPSYEDQEQVLLSARERAQRELNGEIRPRNRGIREFVAPDGMAFDSAEEAARHRLRKRMEMLCLEDISPDIYGSGPIAFATMRASTANSRLSDKPEKLKAALDEYFEAVSQNYID